MCQRSQNGSLAVALERDFLSLPEACIFKQCVNCKLQGSVNYRQNCFDL